MSTRACRLRPTARLTALKAPYTDTAEACGLQIQYDGCRGGFARNTLAIGHSDGMRQALESASSGQAQGSEAHCAGRRQIAG
jgi:hypothetical protein